MIQICLIIRPYLFSLMLFLAIIGLFITQWFYKQLMNKYPVVYKQLGEPTLFVNHSIKNDILMYKFIWKKKYLAIGDPYLSKVCNFLFVYGLVFWVLFILLLIITIICW